MSRASRSTDANVTRQELGVEEHLDSGTSQQSARPLVEARQELATLLQSVIHDAMGAEARKVISITASPGVGKTYAMAEVVKRLLDDKSCTTKILWLTSSKELRKDTYELFKNTDHTGTDPYHPKVAVRYGRSDTEGDEGYCKQFAKAQKIGERKNSVRYLLCKSCTYRQGCKYLHAIAECSRAQLVIGTHEAFSRMATQHISPNEEPETKYALIIVDEAVEETLIEKIIFTHDDIEQWGRRRFVKYDVLSSISKIMAPISRIVAQTYFSTNSQWRPDEPLSWLLRRNIALKKQLLSESYRHIRNVPIEKMSPGEIQVGRPVPMKALYELLEILRREIQEKKSDDSACWFARACSIDHERSSKLYGVDCNQIQLYLMRTPFINRLATNLTIFLDATPPMQLYRMLFKDIETYHIRAEQYLDVTLFIDDTYQLKSKGIEGHEDQWRVEALQHLLRIWCTQYQNPLIVTHKRLLNEFQHCLPANASITYYRSPDSRGSNKYARYDAIMLIGHFQRPYPVTEKLIRAVRSFDAEKRKPANQNTLFQHKQYSIKASMPSAASDQVTSRDMYYPSDDDVRQYAQYFYAAEIEQLIGRLRPSNEHRQNHPIAVMLLIGEPPQGLKIDTITTLQAWLQQHGEFSSVDTWFTENPCPLSYNARKHLMAMAKIDQAIASLQESNKEITQRAVARRAGVSRSTVAKHHQAYKEKWLA